MTPSYDAATLKRKPSRRQSTAPRRPAVTLSAGIILDASEALLGEQRTYEAAQVAYLIALMYESGRTAKFREDIAELRCLAEERPVIRRTYEQVVADRLAEMAAGAKRAAKEPRQVLVRLTCDWPTLAAPGSVPMVEILRLRTAVFICPCERRTEKFPYDGYHRTPGAFPKRWEQDRDAQVST